MEKKKFVAQFLKTFASWFNRENEIPIDELMQYLSKDFHIKSSSREVANSAQEYAQRIHKFREKYSQCKMEMEFTNWIESEDKVAIHYRPHFTERRSKRQVDVDIMAIVSFSNGKISEWDQVVTVGKEEDSDQ